MKNNFFSQHPLSGVFTNSMYKTGVVLFALTLVTPFASNYRFTSSGNGDPVTSPTTTTSSCEVKVVPNLVPYNVETGGDAKGTTEGFGRTSSSPFLMRWLDSDAFSGRGSIEVTIPPGSPLKRALVQMGHEYTHENYTYVHETPSSAQYLTVVARVKSVNNQAPVGWMLRLMTSGERILVQERSPAVYTTLGEWVEVKHTFNVKELGGGEATAFYPILEFGKGQTGKPGHTWRIDSVYVMESDTPS